MRTSTLVGCLGLTLTTACNSSAPAPAAPELRALWRGYTIGDEYWVQVVAHEDREVTGPRGERGFGVADGYRWEIGCGETDGVLIAGRWLTVNGRDRRGDFKGGDLLKRGDRIQANVSTGQVTVNGLAWK